MIDKLEMFIALARERHFGRAAEACGIAQPTLSAAIRQLEAELGVTLVLRGSRFNGLTPEGERALDWARRIAGDARGLREEMRGAREGVAGVLRLAAIPTALPALAALAAPFAAARPQVSLSMLSRTSDEILAMLANVEIDAGVTYLDNEPLGRVETIPLYRETYAALGAASGPLQGRERIGWEELAALPLALLSPDMQNRRILDRRLGAARAQVESNSVLALVSHARAGAWITVLPRSTAEMVAGADLIAVPLGDPEDGHAVGLIAPQRAARSPLLEAFLRHAAPRVR